MSEEQPEVWILLGRRHGDNAQLRALAADLGWNTTEITLEYNLLRELPNVALGASRLSVMRRQKNLSPPWPDLVIGIGRRSVPVARWIRRRSGERTRHVHLGRPRAALRHVDLVLCTAQYGVPAAPNVISLSLPWQAPLAEPPATGTEAHVFAILGGDSWAARPSEATVDALVRRARTAAECRRLPLVATTSPRTPERLAARLRERLGSQDTLYDWAAAGGRDNPYREYLSEAGEIVLTGDSVSALADAVWTNRPVSVVPAPDPAWLEMIDRHGGAAARAWRRRGGNLELGAPPPDLPGFFGTLVQRGIARSDGEGGWFIAPCRERLEAERHAALARLRALIGSEAAAGEHG